LSDLNLAERGVGFFGGGAATIGKADAEQDERTTHQ
jgi:hypothetical protein